MPVTGSGPNGYVEATVTANCERSEFTLDVTVNALADLGPDSFVSAWRFINGTRERVRTLNEYLYSDMTETVPLPFQTKVVQVADFEIPIDVTVQYEFRVYKPDGLGGYTEKDRIRLDPTSLRIEGCTTSYTLRDLFYGQLSVTSSFELGTLPDMETEMRVGEFTIINRQDPVVVFDTRSSGRGVLPVITRSEEETITLRDILRYGNPLLFQYDSEYMIDYDTLGYMYLQPLRFTEVRIIPDGRDPRRRFDIEYVQIGPPPAVVQLSTFGAIIYGGGAPPEPPGSLAASFVDYDDMSSMGLTYADLTLAEGF